MASLPRIQLPESRAPPPSPVAGVHSGHSFDWPEDSDNNDELTEFLSRSIRVPTLNFPYRLFPQAAMAWDSPEIDLQSLISLENNNCTAVEHLKSAAVKFGCFQLVNHGIPSDLVMTARALGVMAVENRQLAVRSSENRRCGFVAEEEFLWWCGNGDRFEEQLAPNLYDSYNDKSEKMENLRILIEKIANTVAQILFKGIDNDPRNIKLLKPEMKCAEDGSILCIQKHHKSSNEGELHHELLRMLMRSWRYSSALTLHIAFGASEFHVYSKRSWLRFFPNNAAIIITIGDQIQEMCNGVYKHVIGKPVYNEADDEDCISIALCYTNISSTMSSHSPIIAQDEEKIISIAQQIKIIAVLVLFYHFIMLFW